MTMQPLATAAAALCADGGHLGHTGRAAASTCEPRMVSAQSALAAAIEVCSFKFRFGEATDLWPWNSDDDKDDTDLVRGGDRPTCTTKEQRACRHAGLKLRLAPMKAGSQTVGP
jgi:hypothetical protein